jgi:hypothetical protein
LNRKSIKYEKIGTYKNVLIKVDFSRLMSLNLEKLSPLVTETGMINKILKETHILGYRSSMLNFLMKFKIFSSVGFLRFSQIF